MKPFNDCTPLEKRNRMIIGMVIGLPLIYLITAVSFLYSNEYHGNLQFYAGSASCVFTLFYPIQIARYHRDHELEKTYTATMEGQSDHHMRYIDGSISYDGVLKEGFDQFTFHSNDIDIPLFFSEMESVGEGPGEASVNVSFRDGTSMAFEAWDATECVQLFKDGLARWQANAST